MAELSDAELRVAALVEGNKWASARASLKQHPGTDGVVTAAETFYTFLTGERSGAVDGVAE